MIKRIILILLLSLSLLNAADYKETNQSSDTNTLSKIIMIPLYPVMFVAGIADVLFTGATLAITYPIRTILKDNSKVDIQTANNADFLYKAVTK